MNFLIYSVEDDPNIALILNKTLSKQGYTVQSFPNGTSFWAAFSKEQPQMVLLDMMLPDIPGSELLKKIRSNPRYDDIQIIIISANHMVMDKVDGFDLGADDYIEKPFDLLELMSRVAAKVRRYQKNRSLSSGKLIVNLDERSCLVDGRKIDLTTKEFDILAFLLERKGKVVSREELFERIWNTDQILESRTLDMHIKSLRSKLGQHQDQIKTVYGIGYQISE